MRPLFYTLFIILDARRNVATFLALGDDRLLIFNAPPIGPEGDELIDAGTGFDAARRAGADRRADPLQLLSALTCSRCRFCPG